MSWIVNSPLTWLQSFCVNVLKCGPIPKHIAIIMDGNRRYAQKTKVQRTEGHIRGFDKLAETLQWCLHLGITEVTVYAFSIENFKRSQEEVDTLMSLAIEKFEKLLEEKQKIMDEGVCIRIVGNLSLLPEKLQQLIAQVVLMTKDNTKAYLNMAFAYTSRDEITHAVNKIIEGVQNDVITIENINEELIANCLYTNQSPCPDLLIRTSGEVRFSDFLLWQISGSSICFTNVLWPEFNIWDLLWCIFKYQRAYHDLNTFRDSQNSKQIIPSCKVEAFLKELNQKRWRQLESYL